MPRRTRQVAKTGRRIRPVRKTRRRIPTVRRMPRRTRQVAKTGRRIRPVKRRLRPTQTAAAAKTPRRIRATTGVLRAILSVRKTQQRTPMERLMPRPIRTAGRQPIRTVPTAPQRVRTLTALPRQIQAVTTPPPRIRTRTIRTRRTPMRGPVRRAHRLTAPPQPTARPVARKEATAAVTVLICPEQVPLER